MTSSSKSQEMNAMRLVVQAINTRHRTSYATDVESLQTMFESVKKAPEYKSVYFLKPEETHEISCLCISSRKRIEGKRRGHERPSGSYTAVVSTGKVVRMCFNSKCKKRNGGKSILVEQQDDETSDDDSDFVSTDDENDDHESSDSNKRQRSEL
jgi:hypothetical protein